MSKRSSSKRVVINNEEPNIIRHLYKIPPRAGRYIVLDTETTGLNLNDHVVELGAHEIINSFKTIWIIFYFLLKISESNIIVN